MGIDIGLDDPVAMEALTRAIGIVDGPVDHLHDEIGRTEYSENSEVYRLARALPPGQISFDRTIFAAVEAVRGALDQVSHILRTNAPTTMTVLHALLRAALVGAGRTAFALLPTDPSGRLQNARVLIAQEGKSFKQALDSYKDFQQLIGLAPDPQYLATAHQQNAAIQQGTRPAGDGVVMTGAAEVVGAALAASPGYQDGSRERLREQFIWLWNTYSGVAHTHAWPQLLPGTGQRVPGDFSTEFCLIAATAHIAMLSVKNQLQPGSANTTVPIQLGAEPSKSH
jgi:hypothetical protein